MCHEKLHRTLVLPQLKIINCSNTPKISMIAAIKDNAD